MKLRTAVIGAGRLGGFHAQKLWAHPQTELVAVADPVEAARTRLADQFRIRAVADARELLGQVDAVVIASPTTLHHALGLEFLRRGTHVLMEKPLAATAGEAEELVDAARRSGAVLQVGHVERFNPAYTALLSATDALEASRAPKYVEAVRTSGFTFRSTDVGVVLDMMIHDLDLVLALVRSPVVRVDAMGISVLGGHEDVATARLEFASGCVATLNASRVSYDMTRRMQVWTAQAQADLDFAARTATFIRPSDTLLQRQFHVDELSPEQVEYYKTRLMDEHLPRSTLRFDAFDALALEVDDFVEAIGGRRPPRVTGEQGLEAVRIAEQILGSIENHAWDGRSDGCVGPQAQSRCHVVPPPHFAMDRQESRTRPRAGR